jgi:hypothetical protein
MEVLQTSLERWEHSQTRYFSNDVARSHATDYYGEIPNITDVATVLLQSFQQNAPEAHSASGRFSPHIRTQRAGLLSTEDRRTAANDAVVPDVLLDKRLIVRTGLRSVFLRFVILRDLGHHTAAHACRKCTLARQ